MSIHCFQAGFDINGSVIADVRAAIGLASNSDGVQRVTADKRRGGENRLVVHTGRGGGLTEGQISATERLGFIPQGI